MDSYMQFGVELSRKRCHFLSYMFSSFTRFLSYVYVHFNESIWPDFDLLSNQPVFLNEVLVKMPSDPSSDEPIFHISHIDRVYTLRTENINERLVGKERESELRPGEN